MAKMLAIAVFLMVFCCAPMGCMASSGDRTQFFRDCRQNCERQNCSADGYEIQEQAVNYYQQTIFDHFWSCSDECQYGCMWRTVDAFNERNWPVPQFYGKWPFVRFLGLQEPASVLFSIMNFILHYRMLRKFRREVRPDTPCYKLWHGFTFTCLNGWIWSTVFHARDFPLTELLDYAFAYSIVLAHLYCMVIRMIHKKPLLLRGLVSLMFLTYFINYIANLSVGNITYSQNMTTNIVTGLISAAGWFLWCFLNRKERPYHKKMLRFYVLFGLAMSLELLDFPPIFWLVDAHALWHLATVPVTWVFYDFIISDCHKLYSESAIDRYDRLTKKFS